ncbi:MAG: hypothetical protein ACOY3N_09570 [Bradyrhizobium sp.]|uniref:hypothetical protein n=1 Tax=Bradyrhizobium sp. TaxID=376 RepID=UPI003BF3A0C8
MTKPLTSSEIKVLDCLRERAGDDENCLPSGFVASLTDLSLLQARRAIKSLQRRGYVELVRGIFNSDGEIAGSGYCCTPAGTQHLPQNRQADHG